MFFLVDGKIRIRILGAQKHTDLTDPDSEHYQYQYTTGNIFQIHMHILLPKFAVVISFINLRHCFW